MLGDASIIKKLFLITTVCKENGEREFAEISCTLLYTYYLTKHQALSLSEVNATHFQKYRLILSVAGSHCPIHYSRECHGSVCMLCF
jgi:hypothetical protein